MLALDPARRDALATRLARRLGAAGLAGPAIVLLEMHRPLAFLGGQLLLALQPLVGPWLGDATARELALFFEQEENIETLIARLEERDMKA